MAPMGPMLTVASDKALYLLKFIEKQDLEYELNQLKNKTQVTIVPGRTQVIDSIEHELQLYFAGSLKKFTIPLHIIGTPFQQTVWQTLINVPYGSTMSYAQEAKILGKPSAYRAVANANGANNFVIIIPCHRIIQSNGIIGGYGGGINRKQWLLEHEKKYSHNPL
jgi:AraC family transcriptional regulator of adaptative response/methylated-DNA-[protein]-cysteine methyltransferase